MSFIVAVDGYTSTGKGTVSNILSKKYKLMYLDTGATYRCLSLEMIRENVKLDEIDKIKEILDKVNIEFTQDGKAILNGEDVSKEIREKDVNDIVSQVSHIPIVRESMIFLQRKMSKGKDVILDGRDIGTVVFPNADVKVFLDASFNEKVKRRYNQNKEKNINMTIEEVKENIRFRDDNDKSSNVSPVKQAADATYIDTTDMKIDEVVDRISKLIDDKKKQNKLALQDAKAYKRMPETKFKNGVRHFVKFCIRLYYTLFFRVKITGKQYLEQEKNNGFIICANHLNYQDALCIVIFNKYKINFVAKADLFRHRFIGFLGKIFDVIPVDREKNDVESMKLCLKTLKEKQILGIFPEGTRKGIAKNVKLKSGATHIAYKTGKKIIPCGISGKFRPFTTIHINYGKPIDVSQYKTDNEDWMDDATKKIMDTVIELTKKPE